MLISVDQISIFLAKRHFTYPEYILQISKEKKHKIEILIAHRLLSKTKVLITRTRN